MPTAADDEGVSQPPPPRDDHSPVPWSPPPTDFNAAAAPPWPPEASQAWHASPPSQPQGPPASQPQGQPASQAPPLPLADRVPGAVAHDVYAHAGASWPPTTPPDPSQFGPMSGPPHLIPPPPPPDRPSGWNGPAFGMLAIFLLALTALLWPQYRARMTERKVGPLVAGLSQRNAGARCPRYITAIFTNVGSVSLDASGEINDYTDLTGPICDGLRRLYTPEGKAEMQCLLTDGRCPPSAVKSVVALSVVAHESMHLRGILDEAAAECTSIGEGIRTGELAGLTAEQGRMIAWAHYAALNPNTPEQYNVTPQNCPAVAELQQNPPGNEASRDQLARLAQQTWVTLGDG